MKWVNIINIHILLTSVYRLSIIPVGRTCLYMKTIYDISLNQMVCVPNGKETGFIFSWSKKCALLCVTRFDDLLNVVL